jgi:alcohol dehydrogenase
LEKKSVPVGPPAADQITVEVRACGLNFADVFACLGLYSATPQGAFTPGLEYSGVVVAKGSNVTQHAVGDRVFGVTRFGGYAQHLNIDGKYCRPLPETWSFEEGAAYPGQAITAFYGIVKLGALAKGQTVLIHSIAGGTGLWAAKICAKMGAKVIGTVGSESKVATVVEETGLSAEAIIVRSKYSTHSERVDALIEAAKRVAAEKYDIVFDSLMGDWFNASHEVVGVLGRHVVLGAGAMTPQSDRLGMLDWVRLGVQYLKRGMVDPLNMISLNKSVMAFNLIWLYERSDMVGDIFAELDALTNGMKKPLVGDSFDFNDAPDALRRLRSGATVGKVVLVTQPSAASASD